MAALATPSSTVKLFVGNLPFDASSTTLEHLFLPFGKLVGAKLVLDRTTRKPRGFGFVTFEDDESASAALIVDGRSFEGRALTVRRAAPRGTGSLKEDDDDDEDAPRVDVLSPILGTNGKQLPCRNLSSPGGCKSGTKCRYSHSMSSWTGPGGSTLERSKHNRASTGKKKAPVKEKATMPTASTEPPLTDAETPEVKIPGLAKAVASERLTFFRKKKAADGDPTPAQMAAFLRSVVDSFRVSVSELEFDMSALGWDFNANCSLKGFTKPPGAKEVMAYLQRPLMKLPDEVSIVEFEARSKGSLGNLISEYGEFDPSWKEAESK
jgi:hypothetical protein